jgi:hypothetical protein
MCVYPNPATPGMATTSCTSTPGSPVCKDFAFDWPPPGGSATLSWVVGEGDAGVPNADAASPPIDVQAPPACFNDTVPDTFKACDASADCALETHQTDCCGAHQYLGVNKAFASDFLGCETVWDRRLPDCGCIVAGANTTDDGQVVKDPAAVAVNCVTPIGGGPKTCRTTVVGATPGNEGDP